MHSMTCLSLFMDLPTSDVTNSVSDLGVGVLLSFQPENLLGFVCECVVWVCGCVGVCKLAHPLLSKCVLLFVQYYKPRNRIRSTIRYWVSLNIGNR